MSAVSQLIRRFVREERGQDILEFAILGALIGVAGAAIFPRIETRLSSLFSGWGAAVQDLWIPDDPAAP